MGDILLKILDHIIETITDPPFKWFMLAVAVITLTGLIIRGLR
jgi:hypothetical protein